MRKEKERRTGKYRLGRISILEEKMEELVTEIRKLKEIMESNEKSILLRDKDTILNAEGRSVISNRSSSRKCSVDTKISEATVSAKKVGKLKK